MGSKDSKPIIPGYDELIKRITDVELSRLKDAYKRSSSASGIMAKNVFEKEILEYNFPTKYMDKLYYLFDGTSRGISIKELISGIILIAKGSQEEKNKVLYAIYENEFSQKIRKDEFLQTLNSVEKEINFNPYELFKNNEEVDFDTFFVWTKSHENFSSLSSWLLIEMNHSCLTANDAVMPTFYQTLAGITHLDENEIIILEKQYYQLKSVSKNDRFDFEIFQNLVMPPLPLPICQGLFQTFDENEDGHIDFKELACGISACCRGPTVERLKFCFKLFDNDDDGALSKDEIVKMMDSLLILNKDSKKKKSNLDEKKSAMSLALDLYDCCEISIDEDSNSVNSKSKLGIRLEEFLVWAVRQSFISNLLKILFQICHIVLGLQPGNRDEQREVIIPWLEREEQNGMIAGKLYYVIANSWWKQWIEYIQPLHEVASEKSSTSSGVRSLAGSHQSTPCHSRSSSYSTNYSEPFERLDVTSLMNNHTRRSPVINQKPGPIDNTSLVLPSGRLQSITNEGGFLKKDRIQYEIVSEVTWKALCSWYGKPNICLPRLAIPSSLNPADTLLELYPIQVTLYRHQTNFNQNRNPINQSYYTGIMAGYVGSSNMVSPESSIPQRNATHIASFSIKHTLLQALEIIASRINMSAEDVRLWRIKDEQNLYLLEDESKTIEELNIVENTNLLIEVRNKDQTWPEEIYQMMRNRSTICKSKTEQGVSGLNNLGNTCFMNSALQCLSNTHILTDYFTKDLYRFEINRINPLGAKGNIAEKYAELVKDLWSGNARTIAPIKFRWMICKYAPSFDGYQQHDSQELLAFVLDGLHEDLNRVFDKPYAELKDSDDRPDEVVANEAWENHLLRNQSIIVDLFHGQLKSCVRCRACNRSSVKFDPFTFLSLPLPHESTLYIEIIVVKVSSEAPIKYGFCLNDDEQFFKIKIKLSELTSLDYSCIFLAEVFQSSIKSFPKDTTKIKGNYNGSLYAFELPYAINQSEVVNEMPITPISDYSFHSINNLSMNNYMNNSDSFQSSSGNNDNSLCSNSNCINNISSMKQDNIEIDYSIVANHNASKKGFIIAMHRKANQSDVYFLAHQRSKYVLFGTPILIPCSLLTTLNDLYAHVWKLVSRFVTPPPIYTKYNSQNHAQDCDDSLCYKYPFILKMVQKDGMHCSKCPWYKYCRGCPLKCNSDLFNFNCHFLAMDWEHTALHLRYNSFNEKMCVNDASVDACRKQQSDPINLDACLRLFTREEHLNSEESYYCSRCKKHQEAAKKLELWSLPPILIIHLKRFQLHNARWVKSQKIVKFPFRDFDPSHYLVPRLCLAEAGAVHQSSSNISINSLTNKDSMNATVDEDVVCKHVNNSNCFNDNLKNLAYDSCEKLSNFKFTNNANKNESLKENFLLKDNCSHSDSLLKLNKDYQRYNGNISNSKSNGSLQINENDTSQECPMASMNNLAELPEKSLLNNSNSSAHDGMQGNNGNSSRQNICQKSLTNLCKSRKKVNSLTEEISIDGEISNNIETVKAIPNRCITLDNNYDDYRSVRYNLYALSCHSGMLGGGHYVAYAKNSKDKWIYYNDSSCREVTEDQIDTSSAYILFYERVGIHSNEFMPDVAQKEVPASENREEYDSNEQRYCIIQ